MVHVYAGHVFPKNLVAREGDSALHLSLKFVFPLPGGVTVARQTLTLFVGVQIPAGQPIFSRDSWNQKSSNCDGPGRRKDWVLRTSG